MKKFSFKRLASCTLVFFLTSCADDSEKFDEMSVEQLYLMAVDRMEAKKYKEAGAAFSEVERQHPYSDWSLNAQIMTGYAYYLAKKYEDADEAFQVFISLHPGHEYVPYAMYMQGLVAYEEIPIVERDQTPAKESADAFNKLINRFPDSKYAKDARLKIDFIRDHLAAKEVEVAHYYQQKGAHLAAINRLKGVVKDYESSAQIPEALYRLVISYLALGLSVEAKAGAAVLGHNHNSSTWYTQAYEAMQGVKR